MIYEYVRDLVNRPSLSSDQECKDNQRYARYLLFSIIYSSIFVGSFGCLMFHDVSIQ